MKSDRKKPNFFNARVEFNQKIYSTIIKLPFIPSYNRYNLTISHEKKFIWFRVAKVGTRTILNHFKKLGVNLDVEKASFIHYPLKPYSDYYKFAFVRNPWSRLVSCWQNKVVDKNFYNFDKITYQKMQSFDCFIDFTSRLDVNNCDRHLRSQSSLIDLNNIDYIGRLETFEEDLYNIFKTIDIDHHDLEPKNVSVNKKPYQEYYSKKSAAIVGEIYNKDIKVFGYDF